MNRNHRRIVSLGLGFLGLTVGLSVAGENLLKNGDFEGKDENGIPEGWAIRPPNYGSSHIVYAIDKEEKHGGNQSLRFTAESNSGGFPGVNQRIKVTPGKTYTLHLWVKGKDLKYFSDGEAVIIDGKFLGADGQPAKGKTPGKMDEELRVLREGGKWIQRAYVQQAPEDAVELDLMLVMYHGTGTVWFDDIVLKEADAP